MIQTRGRADAAHDILGGLPEWFGWEKFTDEYVEAAQKFPNYLAVDPGVIGGDTVPGVTPVVDGDSRIPARKVRGILLLDPRYDCTAEIHLLAVRREYHRTGIGRALLDHVAQDMRSKGVRLLAVKTFGSSSCDPDYDQTRAFYSAVGFLPVEEFPDLWAENPCLLMVKVL